MTSQQYLIQWITPSSLRVPWWFSICNSGHPLSSSFVESSSSSKVEMVGSLTFLSLLTIFLPMNLSTPPCIHFLSVHCAGVLSHFSRVWLFPAPWAVARQLLCLWDSPGKNTGVGCHALLQGIFPAQVSHTAGGFFTIMLHHLSHQGSSSVYWRLPNL